MTATYILIPATGTEVVLEDVQQYINGYHMLACLQKRLRCGNGSHVESHSLFLHTPPKGDKMHDKSPNRVGALCALLAIFFNACRMKSLSAAVALLGFVVLLLGEDASICDRCTAAIRKRSQNHNHHPRKKVVVMSPEPYTDDIAEPPPNPEEEQPSSSTEPQPQPQPEQQQQTGPGRIRAVPVPPPVDDDAYVHGLVIGDFAGQPDYRRFASTRGPGGACEQCVPPK